MFTRNSKEARRKINRKTTKEQFCDKGETKTSSTTTSCADITAIADRYEKIAGLIIPPQALKNGRHTSHV